MLNSDLVDVARSLFGLGNKAITFHTQLTWYDKECEVTPSGFALVEAESVVRIAISSMKDGDLTNSIGKKEANGTREVVLHPVPKKVEQAFRISVEDGESLSSALLCISLIISRSRKTGCVAAESLLLDNG